MGKTAFAVILGIVLLASAGCGSLPKERAVALPGLADASGSVTLIDGFYYYGGYKGKTPCIYKTPVAAPDRNSVVYEFKDWNDPYREYPLTHVYKEDGQLYISYAFGGATLAGEKRLKVSEKG